jgi:hypothetical protein
VCYRSRLGSAEADLFDGGRRGGTTGMPCYRCCKAMEGLECARQFRRHPARTLLLLRAFVWVVSRGIVWIVASSRYRPLCATGGGPFWAGVLQHDWRHVMPLDI